MRAASVRVHINPRPVAVGSFCAHWEKYERGVGHDGANCYGFMSLALIAQALACMWPYRGYRVGGYDDGAGGPILKYWYHNAST